MVGSVRGIITLVAGATLVAVATMPLVSGASLAYGEPLLFGAGFVSGARLVFGAALVFEATLVLEATLVFGATLVSGGRFYFLISTQPPLLKRLSMHLQWGQEALSDRTRWWPVSSSQSPRLVFGARPDPVQV